MHGSISYVLGQATGGAGAFFEGIDSDGRALVIFIVVFGLIMVAVCAGVFIDKIHRRNAEIQFKREMLERGLSVDEIERVLAAKLTQTK